VSDLMTTDFKKGRSEQARQWEPRIVSPRAATEMTGLSRTTIWRLRRAGQFPKPIQISAGRVGFLIEEIESWIAQKRRDRAAWDPSGQQD
jgi:prophage regulatory protein